MPLPVVGVVFGCVGSGVHVVSNQPVEILVTAYSQLLHLLLGDIQAICTEIPQNHNVLKGIGNGHFTTEKFHKSSHNQISVFKEACVGEQAGSIWC